MKIFSKFINSLEDEIDNDSEHSIILGKDKSFDIYRITNDWNSYIINREQENISRNTNKKLKDKIPISFTRKNRSNNITNVAWNNFAIDYIRKKKEMTNSATVLTSEQC